MKPIQTRYKGYFFRSRLEARWAVFFDSLGVDWEYEPEGFEFPDGSRYLPDFLLSTLGSYGPYVEIKGEPPTEDEIKKMCDLCFHTTSYGYILWGPPGKHSIGYIHKDGYYAEGDSDNFVNDVLALNGIWHGGNYQNNRGYRSAVEAARSARFEFGQEGALV